MQMREKGILSGQSLAATGRVLGKVGSRAVREGMGEVSLEEHGCDCKDLNAMRV